MASFYTGDHVGAVVADIGHYATKIGWAGDDYPKSYFRSNVAFRHDEDSKLQVKYDYYTRSLKDDSQYKVSNPIDPVTGLWKTDDHLELMQAFLQHGYSTSLKTSLSSCPLILVERAYNPPPLRQQLLQVLFEEHQTPAVFLAKDAALSCFGCGRVTGTVVDLGYSGTTVTPVYDGYVEAKGVRRSPVGLAHVDELILQQMDKLSTSKGIGPVPPIYQVQEKGALRSPDIYRAARLQLACECREMGAGAAINTALLGGSAASAAATAGSSGNFHAPHRSYELPDGTVLDIPSAVRFGAAECLLGSSTTAAAIAATSSESSATAQRRDECLQSTRKDMAEFLNNLYESKDNDEDEEAEDEKKDEFSEAAAVGISKRRTQRDAAGTTATTTTTTKKGRATKDPSKKEPFSSTILQRACIPYYQTYLDQCLTAASVPSMICDAAYRCDRDQQVNLLGNVVVGGGGACLGPTEQAVPDWIKENLESLIHTHTPGWRVKLLTAGIQERSILSWLGGSILGSMGTFHEMYITRAEYEEWGSAIVNRKCP